MTGLTTSVLLVVVLFGSIISLTNGHNWLVTPVSRANQRATQTGCRVGGEGNPNCPGPCDRKVSQITIAPITIQRGQTLQIEWNRHNHPGGFIRFAWSQTSQSDSQASFDQHVELFVCKDIGGCGPTDPSDPTGTPNGKNCATTITVPTYLTDGAWTLQWAYFGGWYNAGDYYACVDYTVSGGPTGAQLTPYFIGGDFTYPNSNKCLFYSTNALHVCVVEPCTTGTFPPGNQAGAPLGISTSVPTPAQPATTGKQTPAAPVTTAKPTPAQPSTTGKRRSLTTSSVPTPPAPTPTPTPVPTPSPTPTPTPTPPSGSSCTLGQQRCASTNTFQTCGWASRTETGWSVEQSCPSGLSCHVVQGNYIWCY